MAGSTWPADEDLLLEALARIAPEHPELRVVIAPHEPAASRTAKLVRRLEAAGRKARTLAEVERRGAAGVDAVVVERVGVLAGLYAAGDCAYVGGGFGASGLHSVLEPAAAGLPILFGPRHGNAPAAAELAACGGASMVRSAAGLARAATGWLAGEATRAYAAERASGYIDARRGASRRTAELLLNLLAPSSDPRPHA